MDTDTYQFIVVINAQLSLAVLVRRTTMSCSIHIDTVAISTADNVMTLYSVFKAANLVNSFPCVPSATANAAKPKEASPRQQRRPSYGPGLTERQRLAPGPQVLDQVLPPLSLTYR